MSDTAFLFEAPLNLVLQRGLVRNQPLEIFFPDAAKPNNNLENLTLVLRRGGGCNNPLTVFVLVLKNAQERGKLLRVPLGSSFLFILAKKQTNKQTNKHSNLPPTRG